MPIKKIISLGRIGRKEEGDTTKWEGERKLRAYSYSFLSRTQFSNEESPHYREGDVSRRSIFPQRSLSKCIYFLVFIWMWFEKHSNSLMACKRKSNGFSIESLLLDNHQVGDDESVNKSDASIDETQQKHHPPSSLDARSSSQGKWCKKMNTSFHRRRFLLLLPKGAND